MRYRGLCRAKGRDRPQRYADSKTGVLGDGMIEIIKVIGMIDAILLGLLLMIGMGFVLYLVVSCIFGGKK